MSNAEGMIPFNRVVIVGGGTAGWMAAAAVLSFVGVIHGFEVTEFGVANRFLDLQLGPNATNPAAMFGLMYGLAALLLLGLYRLSTGRAAPAEEARDDDLRV